MTVNTATIIGNVTHDPVSKEYGKGQTYTKFNVATNYRNKDKEELVEFHSVVTFGTLAKICKDYLKKGRRVYVRGRLKTSRWEDENKATRTKTEIVAKELLFLDKPKASESALSASDAEDDASEAKVSFSPKLTPVAEVKTVKA